MGKTKIRKPAAELTDEERAARIAKLYALGRCTYPLCPRDAVTHVRVAGLSRRLRACDRHARDAYSTALDVVAKLNDVAEQIAGNGTV